MVKPGVLHNHFYLFFFVLPEHYSKYTTVCFNTFIAITRPTPLFVQKKNYLPNKHKHTLKM